MAVIECFGERQTCTLQAIADKIAQAFDAQSYREVLISPQSDFMHWPFGVVIALGLLGHTRMAECHLDDFSAPFNTIIPDCRMCTSLEKKLDDFLVAHPCGPA